MIWASIGYTAREKFKEMTQEQWVEFVNAWPLQQKIRELAREKAPEDRYYAISGDPIRMDYQEAAYMQLQFGVKVDVESWDGAMITKMKGPEVRYGEPSATDLMSGRAVQIAIPDLDLMRIREVTNLDDCCTDELQKHLEEGWRILAVCPPNAKRRPDYILGRV